MNMQAFEVYCDHEGIAADPDVYGQEFERCFVGQVDVEDWLKDQHEGNLPEDVIPYVDYDMMAKDVLSDSMIQLGDYLFYRQ